MYHIRSWQYRRFHVSYLVAWLAVGCLLGLILAKLRWTNGGTIVLLIAVFGTLGALRSRRWWAVAIVMVVGVVLGIYRGGSVLSSIDKYKNFAHTQVLLKGTIDDDPTYGNRGAQQLRLAHITINSQPMVGSVFASTQSIVDVKRGDVVELRGKLTPGFGSYQAKLNYAELVSVAQAKDPVREVRDKFAAGVRNVVSEPAASLGLGFVVGQRSALPDTLDDQLRIVGLTHIVVASGYNLTILVRFMRRLLAKHSKYLAVASSSGLMVLFVAVSGLSPSMTRAALVTGLSLMAWYYGRRFHPLMLIIYTAAATAMVYPIYLWSDIGWYLSFLAFAGVLIVAPLLSSWMFPPPRKVSALAQLLIETLAAQIMTLPLILFIFGQLPVLSLISNILVAPVIPLAMVTTAIAGVAGVFSPVWLGIAGLGADVAVGYAVAVVEFLASIPWAQLNIQISSFVMAAIYLIVIGGAVAIWAKTKHNFRAVSVVD